MFRNLALALALALLLQSSANAELPPPKAQLGFVPGADFQLATWNQVVDYYHQIDAASDRVTVQELGKTTEGRPFLVAIVSAEDTIKNLDTFRAYQRLLTHPPGSPSAAAGPAPQLDSPPTDPDQLLRDHKTKPVVLITCTIHSSETASTLMSIELLHQLANATDPATREILDGTILLLVPSANPDGVDIVADWYPKTLDKPWEGSGLPRLYHKYAGHDTNRDWYMLNLQETRLLTNLLYKQWFPTITYDVHQMGSKGARLFVPPFYDPINPNLAPVVHQSIATIGAHMAADLARAGKKGILTNAMYDNWWNGGNRTTPQRHHMVGILTEAASVRLASPIFLDKNDLQGAARGFTNHQPTVNFADPWPGGWWRLRDIVDYELVCARSLLTLAARFGDQFQSQYLALARHSIEAGKSEPPYAWVVPADQPDPARAADLVRILHDTGIEVLQADSDFKVGNRLVPAGSYVLPAAQPYRPHLKDMMERQVYPNRLGPQGEAEPPYDVAGWTLPLLMGVESFTYDQPELPKGRFLAEITRPTGSLQDADIIQAYQLSTHSLDHTILVNRLLAHGIPVEVIETADPADPSAILTQSFQVQATPEATQAIEQALPSVAASVKSVAFSAKADSTLHTPRIGVYQPWSPSMDEGWTRLVLEQYSFPYTTLHNPDIHAGRLADSFDVILLPSIGRNTLENGYDTDETAPQYTGGLGPDGLTALQQFVTEGGTLVCFEESCRYVLEHWNLDKIDALESLKSSEFYCPGSLLNLRSERHAALPPQSRFLLAGYPDTWQAYFNRSLAFDLEPGNSSTRALATYAPNDVLASGWLLGEEKIAGKAALVEVDSGSGHILLFGFPPQHRAQTRGTFQLLFNTLLRSGLKQD